MIRKAALGLFAAGALIAGAPALASAIVPGARYEGVYNLSDIIDFDSTNPVTDDQAAEGKVTQLVSRLLSCKQLQGEAGPIDFKLTGSSKAGYATTVVVKNDATGQSTVITLDDLAGTADDLTVNSNREFAGGDNPGGATVPLTGSITLDGQQVPILSESSQLFIAGTFINVPAVEGCPRGRERLEVLAGVFAVTIAVPGPDGQRQFFDSNLLPYGAYSCTERDGDEQVDGCSRASTARAPRTGAPADHLQRAPYRPSTAPVSKRAAAAVARAMTTR